MTRIRELGLAAWGRFDDLYRIYLTKTVCQIDSDEADFVVPTVLECKYERSTVAICAHAVAYIPYYWFSKYPAMKSPIWNLITILDGFSLFFFYLFVYSFCHLLVTT